MHQVLRRKASFLLSPCALVFDFINLLNYDGKQVLIEKNRFETSDIFFTVRVQQSMDKMQYFARKHKIRPIFTCSR